MNMAKLTIHITPTLLTKLNVLSSEYTIEVGGYLTGEIKDNHIFLKDLLIPDQRISLSTVKITGEDQVKLRQKFGDKVKEILGHWHSHASMGCFWSNVDETDMKNTMSFRKFFVWVVSSNGNHLIRVSQRKPFSIDINDCEFYVKNLTIDLLRKRMDNLVIKNTEIVIGEEGNMEEIKENKDSIIELDENLEMKDDEEEEKEESFESGNTYY